MLYRALIVLMVFFSTGIHLQASDKKERDWPYTALCMSVGVAGSAGAIYMILKRGYNINVEKTWLNKPLNAGTFFGCLFTALCSGRLLLQEIPEHCTQSKLPEGREWFSLSAFGPSVYALYRAFGNDALRNGR